jgi:CheY-like chemotaxis protein
MMVFRNFRKEPKSHSILLADMRMLGMTGIQAVHKILKF